METPHNNATLFGKMAKVMSQIRTLEKDGRNTFDKYDYVTSDTIAIRVGKVMAEVGLAFFPSMVGVETSEYTTKNGGSNFRTVAHFQMTIACTETGSTWTSLWSGEAIDRSDKSISKAAVSAVKYFLLKTFLLAGGEEEDADAESPTVAERQSVTKTPDNPFEDTNVPTDAELEVLGTWNNPQEAQAWSIAQGACKNEFEAKQSFKKVVDAHGGRLTKENIAVVYLDALRKWNAKAHHPQAEAA